MACTEADYAFLRELVLSRSANIVDASRNTIFDTRLTPVARMAGVSNVKALVDILRTSRPVHLHSAVVEAMTINETGFFRDVRPFDLLRTSVIPQLIESRRHQRKLRIWSAASSTGQEAYSVAMLLREWFKELATWDIQILGTDISRRAVEHAQRARYGRLEVNRGLPAAMLLRYLVLDGEEWQIVDSVRSLCSFSCLNLCGPLPALPRFDLVLLRNVLLYFSPKDRAAVFTAVHRQIADDGYLLLGNAEQADESGDRFTVEFSPNEKSYFYRPIKDALANR